MENKEDDNNSQSGDMDPELSDYVEQLRHMEAVKQAFIDMAKNLSKPPPIPKKKDPAEKYTLEQLEKIKKCPLHARMVSSSPSLWFSPNKFGYSTYSPGCNACAMGERDRANGLWMSGWGVPDEEPPRFYRQNARPLDDEE